MSMGARDRRALAALGAAIVLIVIYVLVSRAPSADAAAATPDSIALAERRLLKLRQLAALKADREAAYKQVSSDLALRDKTLLNADSAELAQERLLEILQSVAKAQTPPLEIRNQELGAPKAYGDYGEVLVTLNTACRIDQLVNFMSDLSALPESVATEELHIYGTQPEQKMMQIRLTVAGLMPARLLPKKKELTAF